MKHSVALFFAIFLIFPSVLHAQAVRFGVEAGPGLMAVAYENPHEIWDETFRKTYSGMIFVEVPALPMLRIRGGIRYAMLGGRIEYDTVLEGRGPNNEPLPQNDSRLRGRFDITQRYVSVPLRAVFHPSVLPFEIIAGPEAGYLTSANLVNDRKEPEEVHDEQNIEEKMNRLNLAGTLGVARTIGQTVRLTVFYSHGILGSADADEWLSDWRTREFGLSLGLVL